MKKKILLATATMITWAMASGLQAGEYPDPSEIHINDVFHGGNGCPQGSVDTYLSDDGLALTLVFDEFAAESGPGLSSKEARKFCNVGLDIHVPQGWQYSIFKVDFQGYADLDRGVKGLIKSTYRFSGSAGRRSSATLKTYLKGPLSEDYLKQDDIGITSLVWSPCGVNRALNMKVEARLTGNRKKSGLLTVDTIDGEFEQIYAIQWRSCH